MGPTEHLWSLLSRDADRLARWRRAGEVAYKASRPDRLKARAELAQALHDALAHGAGSIPPAIFPESGAPIADRIDCYRIADLLLADELVAIWDAAP